MFLLAYSRWNRPWDETKYAVPVPLAIIPTMQGGMLLTIMDDGRTKWQEATSLDYETLAPMFDTPAAAFAWREPSFIADLPPDE